ncbi:UNKNOWN [Stylonychia lemnae]|uniref:Uncharacterized protein n=1 Tax=Stylonychia lemnae TaxID=5949 RepID=A0A078A8M5_STYLE|nr:UNKNOWN [Stylonychia lemnae]|eukprot:CDW77146.1 UNKNOWN [Stylonychia lemnae]
MDNSQLQLLKSDYEYLSPPVLVQDEEDDSHRPLNQHRNQISAVNYSLNKGSYKSPNILTQNQDYFKINSAIPSSRTDEESTRELTRVNLDKIGKDNLIKIAQLRKRFDGCQDAILGTLNSINNSSNLLEYQKKMAENQVRVDKAIETYNAILQQKEVYKSKLYEIKKENLKVVRKTENVNEEIKELEEALKSGLEVAKNGMGGYGGYGLQRNNKYGNIDEATRLEREKMKKNLYVGVDYIGDEDIRLNSDVKHKSKWEIIKEKMSRFIERISPLRADIHYIEARYDKSITNFFVFFKFIYYMSILSFLIFIYLCSNHARVYLFQKSNLTQVCDQFYPCSLFYARFQSSQKLQYAMTLFIFIVVGYAGCIYQWIQFDKKSKHYDLFLKDNIIYGRALLNCWDWRMCDQQSVETQKSQIFNEIKLKLREDRIREEIKHRTDEEKCRLVIKRVITMILSFIVLVIGWGIIILLSIYENDMQDYVSQYNKFLGTWTPTALVTVVNFIVPKILGIITDFEEWEFASTQMRHEVWRSYLAGILNNLIFAVIYSEVFIDKPFLRDTFIADFQQANKGSLRFPCREDMIAVQYIKLVRNFFKVQLLQLLSETIIRYLYYGYWIAHHKVVSLFKGDDWKKPFETADVLIIHLYQQYFQELVWLLSYQQIIWFNFIFSPFTAVIAPFLLYLHFKFVYLRLTKMKIQPEGSSNDDKIGYFIMVFMNITFLCIVVLIGFMLFYPAPHYYNLKKPKEFCGAFGSGEYWYEIIEDAITKGTIGEVLFAYIISNNILLSFLCIILSALASVYWKNIMMLLKYIDVKTKEVEYNIDDLQYKLRSLQQKDKFFRDNRKIE